MPDRHAPYHLLLEAFERPGCPVCAIVEDAVLRYLDILLHENVNDLDFRDELRRAAGFCNAHGWWLARRLRGGALGTAIMYRDVLHTLRGRLGEAAAGRPLLDRGAGRRIRNPFAPSAAPAADPHRHCPACGLRSREEGVFLGSLLSHTADWRFLEAYGRSSGLCLVHLEAALGAGDAAASRRLLEAHAPIMDRLIADLDEQQRKADYRFLDEAPGAEADSWLRAIEMVNGKQGIR